MLGRTLRAALAAALALSTPAFASGQTVVILTTGTTWTVPADWSAVGASVEGLGGGANGGGGYAKKTTGLAALHAGQSVPIQVSAGAVFSGHAADTCFNSCTFLDAPGANGATGGGVGAVGDVTFGGGNGGTYAGGGAAGPHGAGAPAGATYTGGTADNGFGGAGGVCTAPFTGTNGGAGTEWGAAGSGGGAGGGWSGCSQAGNYGGGAQTSTGAAGAPGVIVVTYTPRPRISSGAF